MSNLKYDAVVIGSGIGGMCTGALLNHYGYKTLVVEKLQRMGGRSSTYDLEGFRVPTGAVAISTGGLLQEVFKEVGAKWGAREVSKSYYRIDGKDYELPIQGQTRALLSLIEQLEGNSIKIFSEIAKKVGPEKIMGAFGRGVKSERDLNKGGIMFSDWLAQYTDNERVKAAFHSLTAAIFAVNSWELPAAAWFSYIAAHEAGLGRYSLHPRGTIGIIEELAEVVKRDGGDVWTNCPAKNIIIKQGKAAGVVVEKDGTEMEIEAKAVVSNMGPKQTMNMAGRTNFPAEYVAEVDRKMRPAPIIAGLIASDVPLSEAATSIVVGARRMVSSVSGSLVCPEWAPKGQYLFVFWGQPPTSLEKCDHDAEIKECMKDLCEMYPIFEKHGRVLKWDYHDIDDDFPAFRTWAGWDVSQMTPIPNLYNVGDGAKPLGWGGLPNGAKTAKIVVEDIKRKIKLKK
ncbi:MAG: FAD-dependent oxidoreductase [Dehalococcoidia bacterium]